MNLSAIFSKTGKGVQEASGKTSHLSRADRSVLAAIDGKTPLSEVLKKFEKLTEPKFDALIQQLDKDGFIREVSSGATQPAPASRPAAPPPRSAPPKAPAADTGEDSGLDFTAIIKGPPKAHAPTPSKAAPVDLAAASRAEAERKAKEQQAFDYKARAEAEAKAKAEAEAKARAAAAEARARAEAEAKARAAAEAKARAEADAKTHADADAKVKAAREAALRLATEAKAKAEAEAKDKARLESELNAKLAEERKAREDAERRAQEAAELARKELEEKAKRDADLLRQRLEAEMKAKLEEERKAREEEDRKRRAEEDRKRREEDERRRKEDEERRAKEEAERKAREEEDRKRREEDARRRKEDEERRAKEEAERKARKEEEERRAKQEAERRAKEEAERRAKEEAERKAREEADRKRRKEEDERRAKEDADRRRQDEERRAKEESERKANEEAERKAKDEAEAKSRAAQSASFPAIEPVAAEPPPAAAPAGDIGDSLLADLDSFSKREEEEAREKEEAERKSKEEAARRSREEAERQAKEEADRKRREEDERRRKEEEARRAREEAERQAREEGERAKHEEAERKRKAKEALAAKQAEEKAKRAAGAKASAAKGDDDIGVTDEDLDMDDIKRDQKALAKTARKMADEQPPVSTKPVRRPVRWGKPAAIALFVLLVGGIGLLNVMPVSTGEYEKAASEAMGVPVKITSARLSVLTGIEVRFEGVSVGDGVKIRLARGSLDLGSLLGGKKAFSKMELEGAAISQAQLGGAVLGKVSGDNFRIERIVIKQAKFDGPLALPPLDVEALVGSDGMLQLVTASGGDKLVVKLSPNGGNIGFEISAGGVAVPFVPALTLSDFGWKGTANRSGVSASEFDGRVYDGVVSGTAKIHWGANWTVEGDVKARALKVGVFAPALVSEGKLEGKGSYAMSGPDPAKLFESAKVQGEFKIEKGVLGSFNLTRALQTGGAQTSGRTEFSELTGQAVYDKGAIQIRNASISAGAMNAGASLDIDAAGALSGRVAADVKTPNQTLRATLNVSGKITDPVVRK